MNDFLPQKSRPKRVLNRAQVAEITYTDRDTGAVLWRIHFRTIDPIPFPPIDFPNRDYTVEMIWREDWRDDTFWRDGDTQAKENLT